nr:Chain P, Glycoprotein B [synthetic construct]1RJZ_Q Chain Q, Glycoprotein B [synthetic construct]1RK1_P Chain P, Glycoprotein B [synthetic construct]
SEIEFARL